MKALSIAFNVPQRLLSSQSSSSSSSNNISPSSKYTRQTLDKIAKELGIVTQNDWYNISIRHLNKVISREVQLPKKKHLCSSLSEHYPEFEWYVWKWNPVPSNFWKIKENHKKYLDWFAEESGFRSMEEWYGVTKLQILKHRALRGLLVHYYSDSLAAALASNYPNYPWEFWRYTTVPRRAWSTKENQQRYLTWLRNQLGIEKEEDWYRVSHQQICSYGGVRLMRKYGGLNKLLAEFFPIPEEERNTIAQEDIIKKQLLLFRTVRDVFKQQEIGQR